RGDVLSALLLALLLLVAVWISARSARLLRDALKGQLHHEMLLEEVSAAELSLKIALDEHRLMFDSAPVGIAVIRDQRIVRCNRPREMMLGSRRGGMVNLPTATFSPDDDSWQDGIRAIGPSLSISGAYEAEGNLFRRDGSAMWCRYRGHAVDRHDLGRGAM